MQHHLTGRVWLSFCALELTGLLGMTVVFSGCQQETSKMASPGSSAAQGLPKPPRPKAPPKKETPASLPQAGEAPPAPKIVASAQLGPGKKALLAQLVRGHTRFALALYHRLGQKRGSIAFSPMGIASALSMTAMGARGKTRGEMFQALSVKLSPEKLPAAFAELLASVDAAGRRGALELRVANRIFVDGRLRLRPYFPSLLKTYYRSGSERVDFSRTKDAARRINAWAHRQTHGQIASIVGPMDLILARLVLANAVYFKGQWIYAFKKRQTQPRTFHPGAGSPAFDTPTMHQLAKLRYARRSKLQILELPYRGKRLAMDILLPRPGKALETIEDMLTAERLDQWLAGLRRRKVHVYLPRFRVTWGKSLRSALETLGMRRAFTKRADFSRIAGAPGWLFVRQVFHKAFVKVDEEGTKAAAVTAVVIRAKGGGMNDDHETIPVFRADRPFLFVIRDRQSKEILFWGRLATPRRA